MEPKAALSAIRDFIAPVSPANAPDQSEGAIVVSGQGQAAAPQQVREIEKAEPAPPADDGPQPGDLRLVIEQDDDSGDYVYKTVDRRTGETLNQYPREQMLKLREDAHYASGAVFDGQA